MKVMTLFGTRPEIIRLSQVIKHLEELGKTLRQSGPLDEKNVGRRHFKPALERAIQFVVESQYPIGAWPQRFPGRSSGRHPGKRRRG